MIVVYHAGCVDGFTAAWCAWRKFGDAAQYIPAHYGDSPPACTGKDVVIVDFSYPRATLELMAQEARSLLVLDHHKTAEAELAGLPYCKFDMNRSGAGMAWDELLTGPRPMLVNYVEDRDLWRWRLNASKEISAWLGSWPHDDMPAWGLRASELEVNFNDCFLQGVAILRTLNGHVDFNSKNSRLVTIGGYAVPTINTTFAVSELVGKLAESADFAAGWFQKQDGQFVYSLRSRGDFDVSVVARQYGGGGHKNAAGFTVSELLSP